ncbi:MAG: hypothetical protein V7735_19760 [Photobacterium frigidiphilum]|uniref:hypothetical protein n=1 Tax=Photobacterium frigidiphilum TaxID=264736 RepID=UPI003001A007
MKKLLNMVLMTNILAALVVLLLSKYIAFFASTSLSDFLFFVVIVIWGIAGLTWEGSNDSRNWELDPAAKKAKEMVAGHDFGADFENQKRQNYQFGLIMFVAGLPAFLGCLLLIFFF